MSKAVLVLADHIKGTLSDITYEMLGIGRKIADSLNQPLYAVIIGNVDEKLTIGLGIADKIFVVGDKKLDMPLTEISVNIVKKLVEDSDISLVLVAGTNVSWGIGSFLSVKLNYQFINFCKNLIVKNDQLVVTSQLYGGKILSETILPDCKGIISINPGSFPSDLGKSPSSPKIEHISYPEEEFKIKFNKFIEPDPGDVDVTKENILVSVGRGIGSNDDIGLADDLVAIMGGAVCASRPIIDQGWLPLSRQIGKSGMIVKPKFYLALGISGAPEHIEGMKDSELIVAINKDPDAPIFNIAHYGVCADINDILPVFIDKLKIKKEQ